jgi:hypothetical protein
VSALAILQHEFMAGLSDEHAGAPPGLEIYRGNGIATRHDALAATYPVVRRLVGDSFFAEAAARYGEAHPSTTGDLHEYGGSLARFLEDYPHARPLPYLPDVARLEWACHESYHAADVAAFDFAALARVPEQQLGEICFRLHPSVRLLHSHHPIVAIHAANHPDRDGMPDRIEGADHALVHRPGYAVKVTRLEAPEWTFLARLAEGATLDAACAALGAGEAQKFLAEALARHVERGVISGCALSPDSA